MEEFDDSSSPDSSQRFSSHHSDADAKVEMSEDDCEDESQTDIDAEIGEFYRNHPCANNEPWYVRNPELLDQTVDADDEMDSGDDAAQDDRAANNVSPFIPPSERDDAPLAGILDPELDSVDPRKFFPEFSRNRVLRFTRLFGANTKSTTPAKIWWFSKTFRRLPEVETRAREGVESTVTEQPSGDGGTSQPIRMETNGPELIFASTPPPEDCLADDELLLMQPLALKTSVGESLSSGQKLDVPAWRFGPASYWYDKMNVPANPTSFDYGFKLKREHLPRKKKEKDEKSEKSGNEGRGDDLDAGLAVCEPLSKETFLPVNLIRWEDDIIYDEEQAREQIMKRLSANNKSLDCGWIPTMQTRSYEAFINALSSGAFVQMFAKPGSQIAVPRTAHFSDFPKEPSSTSSIFPMDDYDYLTASWEDDIIYDSENMDHIPEPRVLTLDCHDDPLLFGMPEDKAPEEKAQDGECSSMPKPFDRKEHQFTKKSKMILGQVQQRQKQEEDEQMESSIAQMTDKDPFNLSNDDYYNPKNVEKSVNAVLSSSVQHSIPAANLHPTFFPTHLNVYKLRHYYRLPIPRRILRTIGAEFVPIRPLTKHIREIEQLREKQKAAEGGGEIFFMRDVQDLSGKDGTLMLMEYSEEHPPLLSQPGMASKIRNYYKRKVGKETDPEYEFGETAFTHTSPFLGSLAPGEGLQSLENNLFRAPIYKHTPNTNDFLLIRTKQGLFIRRCPQLFLVGQQCPLYEVPSPNSKKATIFVRDFLLTYIYRLFWASDQNPRRLKMEDIKNAFPHYAESSVRKRLKQCSDFRRLGQGPDQNYWVLRNDFRLPSKEEIMAMVSPEMVCAQFSMLTSEQRLKDAGYGEKYFFTPENEDDSDDQVTIEDEIKCAPWNTTRAFIASLKGKCLLDQNGIADPTGCGEGFSYVRVSAKPQKTKEDISNVPRRLVTGTNADLRKLPLKEAKEICRDYGVREEEINTLSRWEIIDVIRTLSTQAAKARSDFSGMARFARGNIRFNFADMQEKYKNYCQRIFDTQNHNLSNVGFLSTDEGSSVDDSDDEELATKLESLLDITKGKTYLSFDKKLTAFEQEEAERKALQKILHGDLGKMAGRGEKENGAKEMHPSSGGSDAHAQQLQSPVMSGPKKLKIYRTTKTEDGTETTRIEVITRTQLIEAYVRIRTTRDDTFIQVYAQMDEQYKEERRKEKRRLQDQLRRIRRNELKAKLHGLPIGQPFKPKPVEKKPPVVKANLLKMRCSACQAIGHMKTNKNCPLYGKDPKNVKTVADIHPVALTDEQLQKMADLSGELIAVEGTKLKISRKVCNQKEKMRKQAVTLHIPVMYLDRDKSKRNDSADSNTSKTDPGTPTGSENKETESKQNENTQAIQPAKIEHEHRGRSRSSTSLHPPIGKRGAGTEMDDYLIGPLKTRKRRRVDPKVSMSVLLEKIFSEIRTVHGSEELMFPVNSKKVPDYYTIVKEPMYLQLIKKKISNCEYELRRHFLYDMKLMLDNSILYNGGGHTITAITKKIFELASQRVQENEQKLIGLEKAINPLLDDNDIIGFSYILNEIVEQCKNIPKSMPFHTKVDPKRVLNYYEKIERPMDLGTVQENIKEQRYTTVEAFRRDIQQIKINSELFNGPSEKSQYTSKALEICQYAEKMLEKHEVQLAELEANIQTTINNHAEAAETIFESVSVASSVVGAGETLQPSPSHTEEESFREDFDDDDDGTVVGRLENNLALSGEEGFDRDDDDDDRGSADEPGTSYDPACTLLQSQMHSSGMLHADLALSESDEDDDDKFIEAKRPKLDDLTTL